MFYLVDFENVSNMGLNGLENLTEEDTVIIFYSKNANKLSINNHIKLEASKAKKEYVEAKLGTKNALDFQLATYLGALITHNDNDYYAIISKDEGYRAILEFWGERKVIINMYVDLNKTVPHQLEDQVSKLLVGHADKVTVTANIISKYKTKQGINNALVKEYTSEVAGNLYKAIKPLLKEKK